MKSSEYFSTEYFSTDYIHLNSCGIEHHTQDARVFRKNGRIDYHLLYIHKGFCYAKKNGKEIKAGEGSLIVYYPKEPQDYRFSASDETISCYLHFTGTSCEEHIKKMNFPENGVINIGKSATIRRIMETMTMEYTLKKACYQEMCDALILEVFSHIMRKIVYKANPITNKNAAAIDNSLLLMYEHLSDNLPIEFYAKKCSLSPGRFAHLFTEVMGTAPIAYITKMKLDKAIELLRNTDKSIGAISEELGFSDQSHFSAIFKKYIGTSPTKYRKEN